MRVRHEAMYGRAEVVYALGAETARCKCGVTNSNRYGMDSWAREHAAYQHEIDLMEMITGSDGLNVGRGYFHGAIGGHRDLFYPPIPPTKECARELLAWCERQMIAENPDAVPGARWPPPWEYDVEWIGWLAEWANRFV